MKEEKITWAQAREALAKMNLCDSFLFDRAASNEKTREEFSRLLLKPILGREVGEISVEVQKPFGAPVPGVHAARVDLLVKEYANGRVEGEIPTDVYDYEPENKGHEKNLLPMRTRFYRAKIDQSLLPSGRPYGEMPRVYIIFILSYDPFGKNRMVYTVKNRCIEEPSLPYEDGAVNLYLYTGGETDGVSRDLQELLRYIRDTRTENAVTPDLKRLQEIVEHVRSDEEVTRIYMWNHDYERMWLEEGIEKGSTCTVISQVQRKLARGKSTEEIAEALEESPDRIAEIIEAISACESDSPEEIYAVLQNEAEVADKKLPAGVAG